MISDLISLVLQTRVIVDMSEGDVWQTDTNITENCFPLGALTSIILLLYLAYLIL